MKNPKYNVPTLRKAIRLFELLSESAVPLGISEISRRLGINKVMIMKLVRTLADEGWLVESDGPKYSPSLRPFHFSSKMINRMDAKVAAEEPLKVLWNATGLCSFLSILDGSLALCVIHLDAQTPARLGGQVGGRYPLHSTAPGKVLLAHAGESFLARLAREKGFTRFTEHTICSLRKLQAHLKKVREDGYAMDLEEAMEGGLCYAVPVYNYENAVVAAAGITVLTLYCTPEKLVTELGPRVDETARTISEVLGWVGDARGGGSPS